ncbi:hypothetical protein DY000_02043333 [Brassica cretica]|uniref:RNase H type-1 domain-containing protein n=1 Tax=Brassica cretica TaxID=69181 RepID=A0ABQ7BJG0_BRACR|nr:hypothetical protein DY000_02043333 [Brassica cretica]
MFFPYFWIRHILRAHNTLANKLARGARSSPSALLYVDSTPPVWLVRSAGDSTLLYVDSTPPVWLVRSAGDSS